MPDFYDFACFLPILTMFDERSIAKAIVEAHGGAIRASLPPEGGLHIMITLPLIENLPAE